ncbi:hypothetical protein Bbelb_374680 [Branchiostoma belcheri]|nr:hypothetical protein Bbelb_374680 [Branchiostoma belcheri]
MATIRRRTARPFRCDAVSQQTHIYAHIHGNPWENLSAQDAPVSVTPGRVHSGKGESGKLSPRYNTFSSGSGWRTRELTATFSRPFSTTPVVTIGLSHVDHYQGTNLRVTTGVRSVYASHMIVQVSTWGDTRLAAPAKESGRDYGDVLEKRTVLPPKPLPWEAARKTTSEAWQRLLLPVECANAPARSLCHRHVALQVHDKTTGGATEQFSYFSIRALPLTSCGYMPSTRSGSHPSLYIGEAMKAYKSLDAYKYFTSAVEEARVLDDKMEFIEEEIEQLENDLAYAMLRSRTEPYTS